MSPTVLAAINIIRGEMNGDEFLWDEKYYLDGEVFFGIWKSQKDKNKNGYIE
jgi:hypothetical protein